jgi:hypothetical protein
MEKNKLEAVPKRACNLIFASLPRKCRCEEVCAEAISCLQDISTQKEIAAPPKTKSGGSQRHQFMKCTVENFLLFLSYL